MSGPIYLLLTSYRSFAPERLTELTVDASCSSSRAGICEKNCVHVVSVLALCSAPVLRECETLCGFFPRWNAQIGTLSRTPTRKARQPLLSELDELREIFDLESTAALKEAESAEFPGLSRHFSPLPSRRNCAWPFPLANTAAVSLATRTGWYPRTGFSRVACPRENSPRDAVSTSRRRD